MGTEPRCYGGGINAFPGSGTSDGSVEWKNSEGTPRHFCSDRPIIRMERQRTHHGTALSDSDPGRELRNEGVQNLEWCRASVAESTSESKSSDFLAITRSPRLLFSVALPVGLAESARGVQDRGTPRKHTYVMQYSLFSGLLILF
ncbi:hypothetical protein AV530_020045 [Patagioenas fasciata monilis]|uniref:Uncharacterized protein n=1 Tax=Patagioenas fasciata monilis TaxID=372326 RepID=A0A1V4JHX5_PATFA|nr:hypothetical protein AV530_020045 [Patagioenas fasciata monilis]